VKSTALSNHKPGILNNTLELDIYVLKEIIHAGHILYCYSNRARHYFHEYLTPSDGLNIHEYYAYPYLNNNKVWPA
jgi:hypothetical protein